MTFIRRMSEARRLLEERGLDGMLLSVGADLPYFTGYEAMPLERLTMLVMPVAGESILVVPELEAARVQPRSDLFEIRPWSETEDPVRIVADLAKRWSAAVIGDQTWSTFVLGIQENLPALTLANASSVTSRLRMKKDEAEIEALRRAAHAADRVVERLAETRFSGRTERQIARLIADMTVEEGHETAAFGIVASGPNGASPHHESGDRAIEVGDPVVVDFGGRFDGYYSDTTRDFVVGKPPPGYDEAYAVLREAQAAACAEVRPGVSAESVDAAARHVIAEAGYGDYFIHRTGHGIGLEVHEHPYIVEGNAGELESGMTFSIEPGIYLSGRFGMRIEDIVAVGENGVDRLNQSARAYRVVA